jgi:hypothetical protein
MPVLPIAARKLFGIRTLSAEMQHVAVGMRETHRSAVKMVAGWDFAFILCQEKEAGGRVPASGRRKSS